MLAGIGRQVGGDGEDAMRRGIDIHRARAELGRHVLDQLYVCRRVLMDDRELAFAVGNEDVARDFGSNPAPSAPLPVGTVATTLPVCGVDRRHHLVVAGGEQTARAWRRARARTGSVQGASGQRFVTVIVLVSISTISDVSSMLSKMCPLPSRDREFRLAAERDGAVDGAGGDVDDGRVLAAAR